MKNDDVELIQQVLADDENAFTELVKKYQKPVHALAWRKIGDFHVAEEITQDTFLIVYQRLHTLKDPNLFFWMALCDCDAPMLRLAPKETDTNTTVGGRRNNNDSKRYILTTCRRPTCSNRR